MLVKIYGSAIHGVSAQTITIEVNVDTSGVGYHLVGLPDNAIKESSYRISAALKNVGYKIQTALFRSKVPLPRTDLGSVDAPALIPDHQFGVF